MSKRNTKIAAKTADPLEGERRAWSGQKDGISIDNAWDGTNVSSTVRSGPDRIDDTAASFREPANIGANPSPQVHDG